MQDRSGELSKSEFFSLMNDLLNDRKEIINIMEGKPSWDALDLAKFLSNQAKAAGEARRVTEAEAEEEIKRILGKDLKPGQTPVIGVKHLGALLDESKNSFYDQKKCLKGYSLTPPLLFISS
jgi:hypothetical protein